MAKKITGYIKLQVPAGKANPAPPIGPALGQHGVNIMEFCKAFNAKTAQMDPDLKIPVVITVFADRSFTFETKTPPAADLLKKVQGSRTGRKWARSQRPRWKRSQRQNSRISTRPAWSLRSTRSWVRLDRWALRLSNCGIRIADFVPNR